MKIWMYGDSKCNGLQWGERSSGGKRRRISKKESKKGDRKKGDRKKERRQKERKETERKMKGRRKEREGRSAHKKNY